MYLSADRFPTTCENGIRTSSFVFCLPTPSENGIRTFLFVFLLHWKRYWDFYFRFPMTSYNKIAIFPFFILYFQRRGSRAAAQVTECLAMVRDSLPLDEFVFQFLLNRQLVSLPLAWIFNTYGIYNICLQI